MGVTRYSGSRVFAIVKRAVFPKAMAGVVVAADEVLGNVQGHQAACAGHRPLTNSFVYRSLGSRMNIAADLVCGGLASCRAAAKAARVSTLRMQRAVATLQMDDDTLV